MRIGVPMPNITTRSRPGVGRGEPRNDAGEVGRRQAWHGLQGPRHLSSQQPAFLCRSLLDCVNFKKKHGLDMENSAEHHPESPRVWFPDNGKIRRRTSGDEENEGEKKEKRALMGRFFPNTGAVHEDARGSWRSFFVLLFLCLAPRRTRW